MKAVSENATLAIASDEARRIYTTMFHPVVHTPDGAKLLSNFVHKIVQSPPAYRNCGQSIGRLPS